MSVFDGFPPVPDRLSFKIGEVGRLVGVKPHVLRYWEREFGRVRPRKAPNGHRLYARADIDRLRRLKLLLHERGYTIAGARAPLQQGDAAVDAVLTASAPPDDVAGVDPVEVLRARVEQLEAALGDVRRTVQKREEAVDFWRRAAHSAEGRLARVLAVVRAGLGNENQRDIGVDTVSRSD